MGQTDRQTEDERTDGRVAALLNATFCRAGAWQGAKGNQHYCLQHCQMLTNFNKKLSCRRGNARRAKSVEILSIAAGFTQASFVLKLPEKDA